MMGVMGDAATALTNARRAAGAGAARFRRRGGSRTAPGRIAMRPCVDRAWKGALAIPRSRRDAGGPNIAEEAPAACVFKLFRPYLCIIYVEVGPRKGRIGRTSRAGGTA